MKDKSSGRALPEVVYVGNLLHTKPAELRRTHSARHVVARAVVHLDNEGTAARARLYVAFKTKTTQLPVFA